MRGGWALLFVAVGGCVDVDEAALSPTNAIRFLVQLDPAGRPTGALRGPFFAEERLPSALTLPSEHELLLIEIEEDQLAARFPSYDPKARASMALLPAPDELDACGETGLLEDDRALLVPVTALKSGISARSLSGIDPGRASLVPDTLALRFDARVCDRGPKVRLVPFAIHPEGSSLFPGTVEFGLLDSLALLEPDTLLAFARHGIITVRRGELVDLERDVVPIDELIDAPPGPDRWEISRGTLLPDPGPRGERIVVLALVWVNDAGLPTMNAEAGAGILVAALEPNGHVAVRDTWIITPQDPPRRFSLRDVRVQMDGRMIAYGRSLVVTATATTGPLEVRTIDGLDIEWFTPLDEPNAPHLLADGSGQIFEGDLFTGIDPNAVYSISNVSDVQFDDGTRLYDGNRSIVGVGTDGRAWIRHRAHDWTRYEFSLPPSAQICEASERVCGRRVAGADPHRVLGVPGLGGMLVGLRRCPALFWRSALDGCANVAPIDATGIESLTEEGGIRAFLEHEGRIYVSAGRRTLLEVELEMLE